VIAGVLPIAVIHLAYSLNIHAGEALASEFQCMPYFEGCVSTSRAVRSGPGLIWFKAAMLPVAALMALTWYWVGDWMVGRSTEMPVVRRWTVGLGILGAIALVFYVIYLGTEGAAYAWMRRYGVVFFFGFTALGQLLLARFVSAVFRVNPSWKVKCFIIVVCAQWAIGVFSVLKRFLFDNPEFINRLENITEWLMVAAMSLGFVLMGLLLTSTPRTPIVNDPRNR